MARSLLMQRWYTTRKKVIKFLESGRVREEHTADTHQYRDTHSDILYTESVTKLITITNTEGYAQRNAKSIIAQVKAEFPQYTPENIEERLCAAMHVSRDKFDAQGLGTEVHRLLDLWCAHLILHIETQGVPFPTDLPEITYFAKQHTTSDLPAWAGEATLDMRVIAALNAFEKWRIEKQVVPIATEVPLVSSKWKTGGKIDLLCYYEGVLTLVDYKTGKLEGKYWLQQVLYYIMLRECTRIKVLRIILWQPDMTAPSYKTEEVKPIGETILVLRSVVAAHNSLAKLTTLRAKPRRTL